MLSNKIIIGRIGDAYGIKGWSHVFSFTQPPENIFLYTHWQIRAYQKKETSWRSVEVELHKTHGNAFVAKLKGCDDREQALLLKNHTIAINREQLSSLKDGEYYWSDLIGLQVINTKSESLGTIDHLFEAGSHDIIAVTHGKKTHYIPYSKDVVKSVDLSAQIMMVEWEKIE